MPGKAFGPSNLMKGKMELYSEKVTFGMGQQTCKINKYNIVLYMIC